MGLLTPEPDRLYFIHMPGCPTCAEVKPLVADFRAKHPYVRVVPLDITRVRWNASRWMPAVTPTLVHLDRRGRVHIFDGIPAAGGHRIVDKDQVTQWLLTRF